MKMSNIIGHGWSERSSRWGEHSFGHLANAAQDIAHVSGFTHNFYRYPARFSPKFVRAAIETFSMPGDLILDPFMGGGTTLVEALALGRCAIGTDISSLAVFIAKVKTTLLVEAELIRLDRWTRRLSRRINMHDRSLSHSDYLAAGYYRHLNSPIVWRLRKAIEQALVTASRLRSERLEAFARCVVLCTAQWALDGRKQIPTVAAFRSKLVANAQKMMAGALELRETAEQNTGPVRPTVDCLHRSAVGLEEEHLLRQRRRPKLVLTSPPYPGIHVLYHRWQVDGRKETPAPFWIANKLDGRGGAYYTFGDRKASDNWTYFEELQNALASVAHLCDETTTVVQVVAFSEPARQLSRYLEVSEAAGLCEVHPPFLANNEDGRLWRTIPNRKWHAEQLGAIPASQEVVLFHRRAR